MRCASANTLATACIWPAGSVADGFPAADRRRAPVRDNHPASDDRPAFRSTAPCRRSHFERNTTGGTGGGNTFGLGNRASRMRLNRQRNDEQREDTSITSISGVVFISPSPRLRRYRCRCSLHVAIPSSGLLITELVSRFGQKADLLDTGNLTRQDHAAHASKRTSLSPDVTSEAPAVRNRPAQGILEAALEFAYRSARCCSRCFRPYRRRRRCFPAS